MQWVTAHFPGITQPVSGAKVKERAELYLYNPRPS